MKQSLSLLPSILCRPSVGNAEIQVEDMEKVGWIVLRAKQLEQLKVKATAAEMTMRMTHD